MALGDNELFSSNDGRGSSERVVPTSIQPKKFATGAADIPRLAIVAYNTSTGFWVPWVDGASNGAGVMKGLVWPDIIELDSSDEVLGHVMLRGKVHHDDVALNGEAQADVTAELQEFARDLGIDVQGEHKIR